MKLKHLQPKAKKITIQNKSCKSVKIALAPPVHESHDTDGSVTKMIPKAITEINFRSDIITMVSSYDITKQ